MATGKRNRIIKLLFKFNGSLFSDWYTKTFTDKIKAVPPKVPVISYHCTYQGMLLNALPNVNHGHDKSHR